MEDPPNNQEEDQDNVGPIQEEQEQITIPLVLKNSKHFRDEESFRKKYEINMTKKEVRDLDQ